MINRTVKKIYQISLIACMLCALVAFASCVSCGNDSISEQDMAGMGNIVVVGADGKEYHSYRTACSNGDFDAAREYVGKMKDKVVAVDDWSERERLEEQVYEAEDYIFTSEINALASMNTPEANTRIVLMLNEIMSKGIYREEGTIVGKDLNYRLEGTSWSRDFELIIGGSSSADADFSYRQYSAWCSYFNMKCDRVLDLAIVFGNKELAEQVIRLIRQDASFIYKPSSQHPRNSDYKDVYAHYTNDSKDAAKKKYDEAMASGAFN